jgi:hypothetical protein
MKKNLLLLISLVAVLIVAGPACNKDLDGRTDDIAPLQPASQDVDGGSWLPILLTGPQEFAVAAPVAVGTPEYIAQVNEIRGWQQEITKEERDLVAYWGAGAVLRWNEILRELVAKYNLPPVQNDDGSYPFPSANNPLAYPYFPFANPPYAARAYAYVSGAQYDALVAAWHYKFQYNREAPYLNSDGIKTMLPTNDLPSYPSEDAVVAGAAVEMLKLMFPGEQDFIQQKAEEHLRSRLIAGMNIRSDLDAGFALGKKVAEKFVARARTDRAGASAGNAAYWKQLEDDCIARGEEPWYSLESPRRPPMLPLFGKVKPFLFDSLTVIALRPVSPPLVKSPEMKEETEEVYRTVKNATRDQLRIVHFWADGVGTSTPPGHWNQIAAEDFIKLNFSEIRWARNMALINMALMDAAIVCWDTKFHYFNPRPTQLDPRIKTLTGIPNFPAYISGHSTFSGAAAEILSHINPSRADAYAAMALEASLSRMYGGIHFRADCERGLVVGKNVGEYASARARIDGAE